VVGLSLEDLGGWPEVLSRLFRRENLTADEAAAVLSSVLSGEALPTQIAAFAGAMRAKGETAEEMTGLVRAMREHAEPLDLGPGLLDTCGTGGDRSGSVNVSTMAAVVAAAAGARVCKHGNRAQSSISGSADVFEALGVAIGLGPAGVARCVGEVGLGFCLAPRFHPAMRHAAPVRRELGAATIFNFLGPLAHPGRATRQLIGVGDPEMAPRMLEVLEANGTEHAMVVFGSDGLDELSISAPSVVLETLRLPDGSYEHRDYELDATDLGLSAATPAQLKGGSAVHNAEVARRVFDGEHGPVRDFTLLNAGAAIVVAGLAEGIADGIAAAARAIDEGDAARILADFVRVSTEAEEAGLT
jgi:anthranilate phosphoribosyltransferase